MHVRPANVAPIRFDDLERGYRPYLPRNLDAPILDVGCGAGRILQFLRREGYTQVHGIDRDPESVATAVREGCSASVVEDVAEYLRQHRGAFRVIILKDVVYYFSAEDVVPYLGAMRDALTPGGTLITQVFNGALFTASFTRDKDPGIKRAYTEQSLRSVLTNAGFSVRAMFGDSHDVRSLRGRVYAVGASIWRFAVKSVYVLERGLDPNNPTILTKSIIAVADRDPGLAE